MIDIKTIFPRASQSFIDANASDALQGNVERKKGKQWPDEEFDYERQKRRGKMNKTESEFALILEAMKRNGEILRYEFEGVTLRFAGVRYTPDFVVFTNVMQMLRQIEAIKPGDFATVEWSGIKFIEIKGPWTKGKFERAVERFRHAKTFWPEMTFEMWQKQKTGWKQII